MEIPFSQKLHKMTDLIDMSKLKTGKTSAINEATERVAAVTPDRYHEGAASASFQSNSYHQEGQRSSRDSKHNKRYGSRPLNGRFLDTIDLSGYPDPVHGPPRGYNSWSTSKYRQNEDGTMRHQMDGPPPGYHIPPRILQRGDSIHAITPEILALERECNSEPNRVHAKLKRNLSYRHQIGRGIHVERRLPHDQKPIYQEENGRIIPTSNPIDFPIYTMRPNGDKADFSLPSMVRFASSCLKCGERNHLATHPGCILRNAVDTFAACSNCCRGLHRPSDCPFQFRDKQRPEVPTTLGHDMTKN